MSNHRKTAVSILVPRALVALVNAWAFRAYPEQWGGPNIGIALPVGQPRSERVRVLGEGGQPEPSPGRPVVRGQHARLDHIRKRASRYGRPPASFGFRAYQIVDLVPASLGTAAVAAATSSVPKLAATSSGQRSD